MAALSPRLPVTVLVFSALFAASSQAQNQPAPVELTRPDATLDEQFSLLRGARELPDGKLLVSDWIEQRVAVVDFARGSVTNRGRVGSGPVEFRLPAALLPFRGDSTLLVDVGNSRLAVLDGSGNIRRTLSPTAGGASSPTGADANGRVYFSIPAWQAQRPLAGDTVEIASVNADGTDARTLGRMHGYTPAPQNSPTDGPRLPLIVFAQQDAFAVAPSGRIVIVRGRDYSLEWIENGRSVAKGPAHAGRPVPATQAERVAYARQFVMSSPMSGKGEGGTMGHTPASFASGEQLNAMIRRSTFAPNLPFFRGDIRVDAQNRVWVSRWNRATEPRTYDVFDATGKRIASFRLRADRHIIAVGQRHVHVVYTDSDGLQTLERYPLPELPRATD